MSVEVNRVGEQPRVEKDVTVTVNGRAVTFTDHKATGLEIKTTAVRQGVPIQTDFVLFEVKGGQPLKQVGDQETVTLHKNQAFRAVAPDDNS
jgi:Multiubiquitin